MSDSPQQNGFPSWANWLLAAIAILVTMVWMNHKSKSTKEEVKKALGWSSAKEHLVAGRAALERQDLDLAIKSFTEAIRQDPSCAEAYHFRGITYAKKGDQVRAFADRE